MTENANERGEKALRQGYTTGACATAATKAALTALITGESQADATIFLPVGKYATFTITSCECQEQQVTAGTIKDGGDDPDATHGKLIQSTVSWMEEPGISLDGGIGVGRVTKEGLPIPVGEAAINPVPRQMIREAAQEVLAEYGVTRGIQIVISVPEGEEIAKKTLNGRLGIIGGISILGTRGIVVPFSVEAFQDCIVQEIKVARACGNDHLVMSTGGRSEKYGMKQYPHLPEEAFIEMGDFVGFTLHECKRQGVRRVSLVGMMGKFSKLAQGEMNVHSKSSTVDFPFLARVASETGACEQDVEAIKQANTTSQVVERMREAGNQEFFNRLCDYCCESAIREVGEGIEVETSLYTLQGDFLGKAAQ
ncbi:cobalt-precorrin-5B (C(1))-methyltransferase [Brevibacillus ginsengisoli]|uniref:cobalt-precorrin-5B (C(1))-methyltransferase n=1 Tax=Brevibacillus ginsengisoli TaxID=363854 RepID=UPI003CE9F3F0